MAKSTLNALIADPSSSVRLSLRQILQSLDIERIDTASTVAETRRKLLDGRFDIVLCEYNFNSEENGQDLLEDLRARNVLPASSIFIVVTAERNYNTVVGVAEETPDEYMLKPVQAGELAERIEKAFARRDALMEVYDALHQGDTPLALKMTRQIMGRQDRYLSDAARLAGQILYRAGRYDEAITLYKVLLSKRDLAWAKFGLANVALRQDDQDSAEKALCEIIESHALYLPVYNLLTDLYLAQERFDDALRITELALKISPHSLKRLQSAGQLAFSLGEEEKATQYLSLAMRIKHQADNLDYRSLFHMLLIQLRNGRSAVSASLLKQIAAKQKAEATLERSVRGDWYGQLASAADTIAKRESLAAIGPLQELSTHWQAPAMDFNFVLDFLKIVDQLYADDLADTLIGWIGQMVLRFNVSRQAQDLMSARVANRPRLLTAIAEAGDIINKTASDAARKMVETNYRAAAEKLLHEGQRTRNNRLLLAAANAAAKCIPFNDGRDYRGSVETCLSLMHPPANEHVVQRLREAMRVGADT